MIVLIASLVVSANTSAKGLVENCRAMIPSNVVLEGRIVMRNRRGIPVKEHSYRLERKDAKTSVSFDGNGYVMPSSTAERVLGTDIAVSDLTLDYLWWDDFSFDEERDGESVHGQKCAVVLMRKGERTVKVWVDRKTGSIMQAEEMSGGKCIRRMWGTRIKKFGDRWMANVMEVETVGSGHRTKITVEDLK